MELASVVMNKDRRVLKRPIRQESMTAPMDPVAYANAQRVRAARLDQESALLARRQGITIRQQQIIDDSLRGELELLTGMIGEIEDELHILASQTREFVKRFQRLALRDQFSRVERKADAWHPERYISRGEFGRMLSRERI